VGLSDKRDVELSSFGVQQACSLSGEFDLILMSPMLRAIQTYTYSKIRSNEVQINFLFREEKNGYNSNYLEYEEKQEETPEEMTTRCRNAFILLSSISTNSSIKKVAVITHSGFVHHFCKMISKEPVNLDNCQIASFIINPPTLTPENQINEVDQDEEIETDTN
jgi:broad specificity phosphatase PhoE